MAEQPTSSPSELDVTLELLDAILVNARDAMASAHRFRQKRQQAAYNVLQRDTGTAGREEPSEQPHDRESVSDDSPAEEAAVNTDSESRDVWEESDFVPLVATGTTPVPLFASEEMKEFLSDPDHARWADSVMGARLDEFEALEVSQGYFPRPGGGLVFPSSIMVWDWLGPKELEEAYRFDMSNGADGSVPLAAAYRAGEPDLDGRVLLETPEVFAHVENGATRLQIRPEDDRLIVDKWVPLSDAKLYGKVDDEVLRDAAKWCGAVEHPDASIDDGLFFPITDNLSLTTDELAEDRAAETFSDRDAFVNADINQIELWARREREVRNGTTPREDLFKAWNLNGTDGVNYRRVQLADGQTIHGWERDGVLVPHPDGAPALVFDENNTIIAAGHFDNNRPIGQWGFTDPKQPTFINETCDVDESGRGTNVRSRSGDPNKPLERKPELDGVTVFTTTAAASTIATAEATAVGMETPDANTSLTPPSGVPDTSTSSNLGYPNIESMEQNQVTSGPRMRM